MTEDSPANDTSPKESIEQAETKSRSKVIVHKLRMDEGYQEKALTTVKRIIEGNKFDTNKVTVANFEGELLEFPATTTLQIATKISKKKVLGRLRGPTQVPNENGIREAITKEYLKLSDDPDMIRKIKEVITQRDDRGFAQENIVIPLPFWKKDFVYFEACETCKTSGTMKCLRCAGKGNEQCTRCNGSGMCPCMQCKGAQMVAGAQGNKMQCPTCSGRGRMSCPLCNQTGKIQCRTCRTKGSTTCGVCEGNGWTSNIHIVEIEGKTNFDYPRDELPDKIVALITELGAKIAEHAQIEIIDLEQEAKPHQSKETTEEKKDQKKDSNFVFRIPINYEVFLPYGHIEFDIAGTSYYTFMFGQKATLTHVSPFLEDIIKNGVRKLDDALEGRGDVAENLRRASEYRTLKEAIINAARLPLTKAIQKTKDSNELGIREETLNDIVLKADRAIKKITDKPRLKGMIASLVLSALCFTLYFIIGLRTLLTQKIYGIIPELILDVSILGLMTYLGIIIIQLMSSNAIQEALNKILPLKEVKKLKPKVGDKGFWTVLITCVLFFLSIETTRHIEKLQVPSWYKEVLKGQTQKNSLIQQNKETTTPTIPTPTFLPQSRKK